MPGFPEPPFVFEDFEGHIELPWSPDELALRFGAPQRALWRTWPILDVETCDEDECRTWDEHGEEVPGIPWLRYLRLKLGEVEGERRFSDGPVDALARVALTLHVESGPYGKLETEPSGRGPILWSPRLAQLWTKVVQALCAAEPVAAALGPARPSPACTARALAASGWALAASEVRCDELDEHWSSSMRIDLGRLAQALARGDRHRPAPAAWALPGPPPPPLEAAGSRPESGAVLDTDWAILSADDGSTRLVTPLGIEQLRAWVHGCPQPYVVSARYFLAVDLDAQGDVESVTVRCARDGTFDVEGEDGASCAFDRAPRREDLGHLRSRLGAAAYDALSWLLENHLAEEDEDGGGIEADGGTDGHARTGPP
jgi:hypothetical protein